MSLRAYLTRLTLGTVVPLVAFAIALALLLLQQYREAFRHGAEERTLAVLTAVDIELQSSLTTVRALAVMPSLQDDDLAYFRTVAARVLASQHDWLNVNLALPTGQQILNLQIPEGEPLPNIGRLDGSFERLLAERKPLVSDLALGPVLKRWSFAVRAPVFGRDGALKYVVSAGVQPQAIGALLAAQRLPEGWVGVVLDRNDRIVARTLKPEESLGKLASDSLRAGLAREASGWFHGSTIEGTTVYTPYRRSEATGWTFAMGIPASAVDAAAWRTFAILGLGVLAALGLAVVAAYVMSRRIASPVRQLVAATDALGRGQAFEISNEPRIAELRRLADVLAGSGQAIRERETALRTSEERLRLAMEAGRMGSWEWDVRTNEVKWSAQLEAIHGLAPGGFAGTFAAFEKDVHPEDRELVRRAVAHSLESGDEHHIEYRIVRPDAAVRWVEGRGKVFRDAAGKPQRLVGVCTDVTGRKRAEELMKEADRHKDEFLAMLGHELRNPLAALTAAAHVIKESDPARDAALRARDIVERQTRHMARLIEDLLDVSRIRAGKMTLQRAPLELGELARGVLNTWRAGGRLAGRALSTSIAQVWVDADRARMEQVLSNLLDNAARFTAAGQAIAVTVKEENGEAVVEVADQGEGLTAELAARVFEPFVQGPDDAARSRGGLGLGLALVRRLAELHGGSASAASGGPGRGSTFRVRLPAIMPPAPRQATQLPAVRRSPRRVLIVEDNDDARRMLQAVLSLGGHDVREARDGRGGLALADEVPPDVALIDIGLPDIDGYEVARRLRGACGGQIRLVALTGYGQPEDERRTLEAGFDVHLVKPVDAERLERIVAELR